MTYYNSMDGLNLVLQERWLVASSPDSQDHTQQFPSQKRNYLELYHNFEVTMNKKYHPNVNLGAAVSGEQLLTDHGVDHVKSVICHAKDIISDVNKLNGYEIFLLLFSIHFHDLGNISGREDHEQKIADIMDKLGSELPLDAGEKQLVASIATAHGGFSDKKTRNKDTIKDVIADDTFSNMPVNSKALAAILRFSDELSDDLTRSDFSGIEIPHENEAYHEYSKALQPVSIRGDTIRFTFRIPYELTQKKVGKGDSEVFLYDEILDRMAKCMRELEYCRQYANGLIHLTTADVTISVLQKGSSFQVIKNMGDHFRLTLQGYPKKSTFGISDYLVTESTSSHGAKNLKYENGDSLRSAIENCNGKEA